MDRRPITAADHHPSLEPSPFAKRLRNLRIGRSFAASTEARIPVNRSLSHTPRKSMVQEDVPYPQPRPKPEIAIEVDARAFNARWEKERSREHLKAQFTNSSTRGDHNMFERDKPQRPVESLREGALKAAIWRNENEKGAYHNVTLSRTYKDQDGNLRDTSSFRAKDMLGLSELARRAHHSVSERDRETFKDQRRNSEPSQNREQNRDR